MNIVITGPRQVGKSTLLHRILARIGVPAPTGFMTTFDHRLGSERTLYISGIEGRPSDAAVTWSGGAVSVNLQAFDSLGAKLISPGSGLIAMDELGKFEVEAHRFQRAVYTAFDSSDNVIAVIRQDAAGWMQELKYRDDVTVFNVTGQNRDALCTEISSLFGKQTGDICIRRFLPCDCPAISSLFYDAVHTVNARDYSPEQLDAWAVSDCALLNRIGSFLKLFTLVAISDGVISGFANMDDNGYLDMLYVHKDFQGRGIATALCDALEAHCGAALYSVHASLTAKKFFERRGYRVIKSQQVIRHGVELTNYVMEKPANIM